MFRRTTLISVMAAGVSNLGGQTLLISSEFIRYRPDGQVVSADRAERYRELLSPAVARNAHFTFRATVVQPGGSPYTLHIAQNPDDTAQIRLFQEQYTQAGAEWIPDRLKQVDMPHGAAVAQGQKAQSYLVDVFVPPTAEGNMRFRIEVQYYRGDGWLIYPMEIRVRQAKVESRFESPGELPGLTERLIRGLESPLRTYACGLKTGRPTIPLETGRALLLRNIAEDLDLARQRETTDTRDGTVFMLLKAAGLTDLPSFCAKKASPTTPGPEWWLKARDYLYQGRPVP